MKPLKIGLLGLSDPAPIPTQLIQALQTIAHVDVSPILSCPSSPVSRARLWNQWMKSDYDYIFDVSGGNLSTLTLPFLDLSLYGQSTAIFAGYSDLTPILNALYTVSKKPALLFSAPLNISELMAYLSGRTSSLFDCGLPMTHVLGGNIRSLLKLAGTRWWPDMNGQTLLLEANSGTPALLSSMCAQLVNMGVFNQISALVLGQFTQTGNEQGRQAIISTLKDMHVTVPAIYTTNWIGHAPGSRAIWIGE